MQFEPGIVDEFMSWEQYHSACAQSSVVVQSTPQMKQIPKNSPDTAVTWTARGFVMFVLMWHSSPPADTQKEHC